VAENALAAALDELRPTKGPTKSTCKWLSEADPEMVQRIRTAFDRGNTYTSIGKTMRANGAQITLVGIKEHRESECQTCRISLRS
jgi:hypothetical protein